MSTQQLVLVDGSSYLFRAYHALPPLTNSKDQPTGAVYGVTNMLKRLIKAHPNDRIAVIFDTKGKTFRHDLYSEYKANRPEIPEELAVQIEPLHRVIRAMGLPLIAVPGVEADDVIATYTKQAQEQNIPVLLSTGDKDLTQLVCAGVLWSNSMTNDTLDIAGVEKKFGIGPALIGDYLALIGDSVDNVPGVPKVGPKTAVKWLESYGTLDRIIEYADTIKGKVGENLRNNIEQLRLSRTLVTLKDDVALEQSVTELHSQPEDKQALRDLFAELEFKSWLLALEDSDPTLESTPVSEKTATYVCVTTEKELSEWVKKCQAATLVAFDTESTSLNYMQAKAVGISIAVDAETAAYIPFNHDAEEGQAQLSESVVIQALKPIFEDESKAKVAHHIKYDAHILSNCGVALKGPLYDTMVASYIYNSVATRHNLDDVAKKYLGLDLISFEMVAGKGANQKTFNQIPIKEAITYAAEDAHVCWQLHQHFSKNMPTELARVYDSIERPLLNVLYHMECRGVALNCEMLSEQSIGLTSEIDKLSETIFTIAGEEFNLSSPKQLQHILYEKLGLPILSKTPTGQPSTAEGVLQDLAHEYEVPKLIMRHRSLMKLKTTYTDKLPLMIDETTKRLHTSYHQAIAATGRLSSSEPNLQNIPIRTTEGREIRKAFVARKGYVILAADYSQVELRIMAHLSADPGLLKAFSAGEDIHRFTASEIFSCPLDEVTSDQRRKAKAINFGLIYGMSAFGLAKQLSVERSDAQAYIDHYFERYPTVKIYMDSVREQARKKGYVETLQGRRLYLPDIRSKNVNLRRAAERAAINAPMQGTAADLIKTAMIEIDAWCLNQGDKIQLIMQVHDELVFEVKEACAESVIKEIKSMMAHPKGMELAVPLVVDVGFGENWENAHP